VKKQELLEILEQFPEEIDPEQLMHDLYLRAKIEKAELAVDRGQILTQQQVVERTQQWFRSSGQRPPHVGSSPTLRSHLRTA
jgi:hypothetical protein